MRARQSSPATDAQIKIGVIFTNVSLLNGRVLDVFSANNQSLTFRLSFDGSTEMCNEVVSIMHYELRIAIVAVGEQIIIPE